MNANAKKGRERRILDLIYDTKEFLDVRESECPDFVFQRRGAGLPFGVEVTEYYASGSYARLRNIPDYFPKILAGGRPVHRDDIEALHPVEVEIRSSDGISKRKTKGIINPLPSISEHLSNLIRQITDKERKFQAYQSGLSHINLILNDTESQFALSKREEFFNLFFTRAIRSTLARTPFREIFYITTMGGEEGGLVYVPLRQVFLVSELFFFNGARVDYTQGNIGVAPAELLMLFGAFMASRDVPVETIRDDDGVKVRLEGVAKLN